MTAPTTCYCRSYPFPHRSGGGKCPGYLPSLCTCCGLPAEPKLIDTGIGAYEFWGSKGNDVHTEKVSKCCEAGLVPNTSQSHTNAH